MPIKEEKLAEIIKELLRNGYEVERKDAYIMEDGLATGSLTIKRTQAHKKFKIITEIPNLRNEVDHETKLITDFGL